MVHTAWVTDPAFRHPVASLWQDVVNSVDVPLRREQRDLAEPVPVRARFLWALDGETWLDGRVMAVWDRRGYERALLVHRDRRDERGQALGMWLKGRDVRRLR